MQRIVALVLRLASVPVGVGVGLWTSQLMTFPSQCSPEGICLLRLVAIRTFATWQCALFGAGASVVMLLLSLAVTRLPSTREFRAS
jgi:hypothetical protein